MPILASRGKPFVPAPEGVWDAVCVDVVDLGVLTSQWGEKHKVKICWELMEKMEDGKHFLVQKQYTLSLHEKSLLHKDLKSWRGKPFEPAELEGFDLEKLIGVPCQLVVTQEEKDGAIYGNATAILKPKVKVTPSGSYVRVKDREGNKTPPAGGTHDPGAYDDPDAMPF